MDPLIKSQLLYQLSYAPTHRAKADGAHIAIPFQPVQPFDRAFGRRANKLSFASPTIHARGTCDRSLEGPWKLDDNRMKRVFHRPPRKGYRDTGRDWKPVPPNAGKMELMLV